MRNMKKYVIAFLDRADTWRLVGGALPAECYKERCLYSTYHNAQQWIEDRTTQQRALGKVVMEYIIIDIEIEE